MASTTSPSPLAADCPPALAAALAGFPDHAPEVRHWRHYPYADATHSALLAAEIDERLGACETYSAAFTDYLRERGFRAQAVEAQGDPEVSYHRWTRVWIGARVWNVDWTARQFHNLAYPPRPEHADLPSPLVWEGDGLVFPVAGVAFSEIALLEPDTLTVTAPPDRGASPALGL